MTLEEAKELVLELVVAAQEFDRRRDKYYRLQFEEVRDRVVAALAVPE